MFLELLRHFRTAKVDFYFNHGKWNLTTLRTDTELILAHRKEAGAPPPLGLEEVEMPQLPDAPSGPWRTGRTQTLPPRGGPDGRPSGGRSSNPGPPKVPPLSAARAKVKIAAASPETLKAKAFATKWGLEATWTRLLLSRYTQPKRQVIMDNFAGARGTETTKDALQRFIRECEARGWTATRHAASTRERSRSRTPPPRYSSTRRELPSAGVPGARAYSTEMKQAPRASERPRGSSPVSSRRPPSSRIASPPREIAWRVPARRSPPRRSPPRRSPARRSPGRHLEGRRAPPARAAEPLARRSGASARELPQAARPRPQSASGRSTAGKADVKPGELISNLLR